MSNIKHTVTHIYLKYDNHPPLPPSLFRPSTKAHAAYLCAANGNFLYSSPIEHPPLPHPLPTSQSFCLFIPSPAAFSAGAESIQYRTRTNNYATQIKRSSQVTTKSQSPQQRTGASFSNDSAAPGNSINRKQSPRHIAVQYNTTHFFASFALFVVTHLSLFASTRREKTEPILIGIYNRHTRRISSR